MSKAPVRSEHTGTRIGDSAQRSGQDAARRLNAQIFDGGKLISSVVFAAGTPQSIPHGLGRKAVGWIEVYGVDTPSSAHVGLFASAPASGITSATYVTVTPTNSGTCSLFVY